MYYTFPMPDKFDFLRDKYEQHCDSAYEKIHGKPDLIVFGEEHTMDAHTREQARSIVRNSPEYVLLEAHGQKDPQDLQHLIEAFSLLTVREVMSKADIPLSELESPDIEWNIETLRNKIRKELMDSMDFLLSIAEDEKEKKRTYKESMKEMKDEDRKIPRSLEKLLDTPLYQLPRPAKSHIVWTCLQMLMDKIKEQLSTPGCSNPDELKVRHSRLVAMVKLLSLNLSYIRELDGRENPIYLASAKVGAKLAGCDIDKSDSPRYEAKDVKCKNQEKSDEEFFKALISLKKYIGEKNEIREKTMGERMARFVHLKTKNTPVISIVGQYHIRKKSFIHGVLQNENIRYRCISQRDQLFTGDEQAWKSIFYGPSLVTKK